MRLTLDVWCSELLISTPANFRGGYFGVLPFRLESNRTRCSFSHNDKKASSSYLPGVSSLKHVVYTPFKAPASLSLSKLDTPDLELNRS